MVLGEASLARSRAELTGLIEALGARTVAGWTGAESDILPAGNLLQA